jgi:hypothetical protein
VNIRDAVCSLRAQADSVNWSERETAGFMLRDMMEVHFDQVFQLTKAWVHDPSERVRRAVCLACMQRKRFTTSVRLRLILERLESLMADDSLYVRKCCGPFVVGYLGYTYPTTTLPWLEGQVRSPNLNTRANVAKAFSQALGGKHPVLAFEILHQLCDDPERRVRSAVGASVRNILRRKAASTDDIALRFPELLERARRL